MENRFITQAYENAIEGHRNNYDNCAESSKRNGTMAKKWLGASGLLAALAIGAGFSDRLNNISSALLYLPSVYAASLSAIYIAASRGYKKDAEEESRKMQIVGNTLRNWRDNLVVSVEDGHPKHLRELAYCVEKGYVGENTHDKALKCYKRNQFTDNGYVDDEFSKLIHQENSFEAFDDGYDGYMNPEDRPKFN